MIDKYIMAIDEGTTSTRTIIFNRTCSRISEAQREFTQYFPHPGWVEHDANEIWNAVSSTIADCFIQNNIKPEQIAGIGITNQRETTIIWDASTGLPIYNAIVWQSRQTEEIVQKLKQKEIAEDIPQKTGLLIDSYFSATKIRWILDHVKGAQQRAEKGELLFGTINTWLIWKMTGGKVHVTDYTNASRTMLFNIHDLTWDKDILQVLKIPKKMLPEVKSNSEIYGYTASYNFFGSNVPISGMAGDQQASSFGQMSFEPGTVKNTYGTGSFVMMNTGKEIKLSQNNLLTTIAYGINDEVYYALEGSIYVAGSAIQWLRDQMQLLSSSEDSYQAAIESTNEDEVYVVPAFTGLGAPYWDADARGAIFGITRGTSRNDFIKATLQSIAYQTRDVIDTMHSDTDVKINLLNVDGGAAKNDYLMQFQADILNIPIKRAHNLETTALGAAFLAGLAVGYWRDLNELIEYSKGEIFYPKMNPEKRQKLYLGWQKAVTATRIFKNPDF
ncbi:glycerol kinase GlpK [Xylocopilactobacillus apicola]|uniref:Glycerol kinase n=1 Tax=Xylocopilactobacillus apicola TaxID=2932184 RepID=A0AAU9D4Q4_9LACO|nr:glycerol kinase GlpK [Xylocopilactobacillus apicola]BDR58749.1 glycerol kinase [Xylocopilactobacillus apicola]